MKKVMMVIYFAIVLSGCGLKVGPVTLPEGFAFSVGVNNIDHVIDRKGLNVEKKAERY